MSNKFNLDVRVYPIEEPKGNTLAFASITIDDLAAIRGIRVVDSKKGLFVTMPQSQDNTGIYHDIAFPLNGHLRKEFSAAILDEFQYQMGIDPGQRGYGKSESDPSSRPAADIKLDIKVYPIDEPKGNTLAFASVGLDNVVAVRGIRIVSSDKGPFVAMPQSKNKNGEFHDVAFPLSGDLRKVISNAILTEHKQLTAERKPGIGEKLTAATEQAARKAANVLTHSVAKKPPGLGD